MGGKFTYALQPLPHMPNATKTISDVIRMYI